LKRVQITRARMRTGPAGVCVALLTAVLPVTVRVWLSPEAALFSTIRDGGVDLVERTGSALLTLGRTVLPQVVPAHLRAGSSFGTGGGAMVTNGGFEVVGKVPVDGGFSVGGIVGGGCTPAWDERGITAKFG
jgi:hypothetical protein